MIFSQLKTISEFTRVIATIDDPFDLTEVRDVVRAWNRGQAPHALRHPRWGFSDLFDALDERANALGFTKYSFGYRKPANTAPQ